ncbi:MAG: hypothetical protein M5R36_04345 [Deltaproteobacteria bacterium]|nr:hypothetical protein [Deltaproteobacteria bacterium]
MRSRRTVVVLTLILAAAGVAAAIAAIRSRPRGQEIVSRTFPFPWTVRVKDMPQGLVAEPGGHWQLKFDADVDLSRHDERYGVFTSLVVGVAAELRYDVAGAYRQGASSFAVTARFTTTGMPIERHDGWPRMRLVQGKGGSPFEAIYEYELPTSADRRHAFSGALDVALPEDTPPGHYEPKIYVFARVAGVKDPIHLAQYGENWAERVPPSLALVKIGQAADPHMPWTIMAKYRYRGQVGTLPLKDRKNVEICARSGFPAPFTVRPGIYDIAPSFPTIFPKESMPPVDGGLEVVPEAIPHHLRFDEGIVRGRVEGPDGTIKDLGEKPMEGQGETGPNLQGGPFRVDMSETGRYLIHLTGTITEDTGRSFTGGGTYVVYSAMPLSFSTSCKPGNSFLVGNRYPAKVNVNPPFPADVDVIVDYYPNSDASRKVHWEASGKANVFGHFVPYDKPMIEFTEPGEYVSYVTTRYIDSQGRLWMHSQTSSGVIAPEDGPLELHGTRTFPYDIQLYNKHYGGVKIFAGRPDVSSSFLSYTPAPMPDPYAPYDPRDTLYIAANGFNESLVEPHLTMTLRDTDLAKRLQKAYAHRSILIPPSIQPKVGRWHYLQDVVQVSTDSAAWFPADDENLDELPILPVGSDGWHPFAFPGEGRGGGVHVPRRHSPRFPGDDLGVPVRRDRPVLGREPQPLRPALQHRSQRRSARRHVPHPGRRRAER